jgi:hypothetical protein
MRTGLTAARHVAKEDNKRQADRSRTERQRTERVLSENSIRRGFASQGRIIASLSVMLAILHALGMLVADLCAASAWIKW